MSTQETVRQAVRRAQLDWRGGSDQAYSEAMRDAAIAAYESDPPEWLRLILREMVGRSALVHLLSAVPEPALNAAGITRHPVEASS